MKTLAYQMLTTGWNVLKSRVWNAVKAVIIMQVLSLESPVLSFYGPDRDNNNTLFSKFFIDVGIRLIINVCFCN